MATVTKRQQQQVLAAVKEQFKVWVEAGYEPKLMDYDGTPSVVWEEGPYDWTMLTGGGVEEEFGFRVPAGNYPEGVFLEPLNGCVLGLYPDC